MMELSWLSASCAERRLSKGTTSNFTAPAQLCSLASLALYWKLLSTFRPSPAMGPLMASSEAIFTTVAGCA